MICDLLAPVLVMEQFILIAVCKDAGLAEDFVRVALPAESADFSSVRDLSVAFGADADSFPVLLHGQKSVELLI